MSGWVTLSYVRLGYVRMSKATLGEVKLGYVGMSRDKLG
jgi:hypothetical protein